jgi:hypothetical protein
MNHVVDFCKGGMPSLVVAGQPDVALLRLATLRWPTVYTFQYFTHWYHNVTMASVHLWVPLRAAARLVVPKLLVPGAQGRLAGEDPSTASRAGGWAALESESSLAVAFTVLLASNKRSVE